MEKISEKQILENYRNKEVGSFIVNALDKKKHKIFELLDSQGVLMEIPKELEKNLGYSKGYKTVNENEFISTYGASTCICLLIAHKESKTLTKGHFPSIGKITHGMREAFTNPGLETKFNPDYTEVHIFSGTQLKNKDFRRKEKNMLINYIQEIGINENKIHIHTPKSEDMVLRGLYSTGKIINFRYEHISNFFK